MIGAIAGDIIGSIYERYGIKTKEFPLFDWRCRFTDDTVLTIAVADTLLSGGGAEYAERFRAYFHRYPDAGYGGTFYRWAQIPAAPAYGSYGNGSAMRVSPVGWLLDDLDAVVEEAKRSAEVTHNHPEGIRGAQAVAAAVFLARKRTAKPAIKRHIETAFGYDLSGATLDQMRPEYQFDVTCQGTVPVAMLAFLEGEDYEDTVRNAISMGGDSDTLACIAGSIAEAYFGVPEFIAAEARARLDQELRGVVERFDRMIESRSRAPRPIGP